MWRACNQVRAPLAPAAAAIAHAAHMRTIVTVRGDPGARFQRKTAAVAR
jgi:hypothetical protein